MTCPQIQKLLIDYSENQLSSEKNNIVLSHLDCCPHCKQLLSNIQTTLACDFPIPELNADSFFQRLATDLGLDQTILPAQAEDVKITDS